MYIHSSQSQLPVWSGSLNTSVKR